MPDKPKQWNDKILLGEMTYGKAICLLGEISCGMALCKQNSISPQLMLEFGQQLIEIILTTAEEETVAPFREAWSKLYYNSSASVTH